MVDSAPSSTASGNRLTVAVPREIFPNETRVGLVPDAVKRLSKTVSVIVESGAGTGSAYSDQAYTDAGASIVPDAATLYERADLVLKIQKPQPDEVRLMRPGSALIALLQPQVNTDLVLQLADRGVTALSMDAIPRITRAQSMDALSSMSTVAGYKAVLLAADFLPKFFPMLMTAAGTIAPAKVLIIGAGVAGLQAIATAKRLGAVVESYDTRPVVKEQVESLGAKFVEVDMTGIEAETQDSGGYAREASPELLRRQQETMSNRAIRSDVIITTALVPGRPAPKLLMEETVRQMQPGTVIVDMAAEAGGNCELTVPGEVVTRHGVTIIGLLNLPATIPFHASQMYSKNIENLLALLITKEGEFKLNFEDEIVRGTVITLNGEVIHEATKAQLQPAGAS